MINHHYFLPQSRSKVAFPDSPRNSTREYCVSQAQQAQHRIQPCWQSSWDLLGERGAHIPWVLIKNQVAKGFWIQQLCDIYKNPISNGFWI